MPIVTRNSFGAAVTVQLGLPAADDHVPGVVDAVAGLLYRWHDCTLAPEDAAVPAESAVWPDDLFRGAVMLAAKLHRRRNTPDGTLANDDYGPVYVARSDPDISMLLRLGKWQQGFAI